MSRTPAYTIVLGILLASGTAAAAENLDLLCVGEGGKITSQYKSAMVWDAKKKEYVPDSRVENASTPFSASVSVRITGDDGRIRLDKALIPPIHGGGSSDGWWQLDDVIVGDKEIRASFKLNGLNHPKLRIDRTTGMLTMKGTGLDFAARCDKTDSGARRF